MHNNIAADIRYAVRVLRNSLPSSFVAILIIGLCIGCSATMFSLVEQILLRPLPFRDPSEIFVISEIRQGRTAATPIAPSEFTEWTSTRGPFDDLASFFTQDTTVLGGRDPERIKAAEVSPTFFQLLGPHFVQGRGLHNGDWQADRRDVAVVGESLWNRYFGAVSLDHQTLMVDGRPTQVIGVVTRDFRYPIDTEIWRPLPIVKHGSPGSNFHFLSVIGRTAQDNPAVTSHLGDLVQSLSANIPSLAGHRFALTPITSSVLGDFDSTLLLLFMAVLLVVVVSCCSIAGLLLARLSRRRQEYAVRVALGATRGRLARLAILEALVLAAFGLALGLLVALWTNAMIPVLHPQDLPRHSQATLDIPVIIFSTLLCLVASLLSSGLPAIYASQADLSQLIKQSGKGVIRTGGSPVTQTSLVVAQFTLSLMLLVGAGTLLKGYWSLSSIDVGFDTSVINAQVVLPSSRYATPDQVTSFFSAALDGIRARSDVKAASAVLSLPLSGARAMRVATIETADGRQEQEQVDNNVVTNDYFRTMGAPVLAGRDFTQEEATHHAPVAIVNRAFVRQIAGGDPIGRNVSFNDVMGKSTVRIIGVVGDMRTLQLNEQSFPTIYLPRLMSPRMTFVIKPNKDNFSSASIKDVIRSLDNQLPINFRPLDQIIGVPMARPRFQALIVGIFAFWTLLVAVAALGGLVAFRISERQPELALKSALGADHHHLAFAATNDVFRWIAIGVPVGLLGTFLIGSLLKSSLFGVQAMDPFVVIGATSILLSAGIAVAYLTAGRMIRAVMAGNVSNSRSVWM